MTRQPVWKLNVRLFLIALLLLAMGGYLCWGLMKLSVEETESYQVTAMFIKNREQILKRLLEE